MTLIFLLQSIQTWRKENAKAMTNLLEEYTQPRLPLTQYNGSDVVSDSR